MFLFSQKGNLWAAKILIAFGANVNAINQGKQTPLDLASESQSEDKDEMVDLLTKLGGKHKNHVLSKRDISRATDSVVKSASTEDFIEETDDHQHYDAVFGYVEEVHTPSALPGQMSIYQSVILAHKLDDNINALFENFDKLPDLDTQVAIGLQGFELQHWKKTSESSMRFEMFNGKRLLFLDGGGMKGLIQVEVLCQIEKITGKKVTEIFDWIIGTSTGAIVAMSLIYCESSIYSVLH